MDDVEEAIRSLSRRGGWFNGEAFINPYSIEGEKTIAYEIAIQRDWQPPDAVFFPLGSAACLVASFKGFRELQELGCINKIPKIFGVQFKACSPIAKAFEEGKKSITRFLRQQSFSTTLMHEDPIGGEIALRAIRDTGGMAMAVSDHDVKEAMRLLAQEAGCFAEPAGAIALAGAIYANRCGIIDESFEIICLVTGSGLNQVDVAPQGGTLTEPMNLEDIASISLEKLLAYS
jgi:threonine synthase